MCSTFLARLRVIQTEFQDRGVPSFRQWFTVSLVATQTLLTKQQQDIFRFPNASAYLLSQFVEAPLRGLALPAEWQAELRLDALRAGKQTLAAHESVRRLLHDVLASGCVAEPQLSVLSAFAAQLATRAPWAPRPLFDSVLALSVSGHGVGIGAGAVDDLFAEDRVKDEVKDAVKDEVKDAVKVAPHAIAIATALQEGTLDEFRAWLHVEAMVSYWLWEGLPKLDTAALVLTLLHPAAASVLHARLLLFFQDLVNQHVDRLYATPLGATPPSMPVRVDDALRYLKLTTVNGARLVLVPRGHVVHHSPNPGFRPRAGAIALMNSIGFYTVHGLKKVHVDGSDAGMHAWLHALATATVNDSLAVKDTWVPIEMLYLLDGERPMIQTATAAPSFPWQHRFGSVAVNERPRFHADPLPLDMTAAEGLKRVAAAPHFTERRKQMFGHHVGDPRKAHADDWHKHRAEAARAKRTTGVAVAGVAATPSAFMAPLIDMGSWPPFRSVDAGLHRVMVTAAAVPPQTDAGATYQYYVVRDRTRALRTADTIANMIVALSGFVNPTSGEAIAYASEEVTRQQQQVPYPLFISFHRDVYERLIRAGRHADAARDLALTLNEQSLWFLALIAFTELKGSGRETVQASSSLQRYQEDLRRAAFVVLETLPGPTFPVRLNVNGSSLWELRGRKTLHGQWFVEVPMRLSVWEPKLLPQAYFHREVRNRAESNFGTHDWQPYKTLVHHFLWHSAGLACVAPAAVLFHCELRLADVALYARLQLLWNGTDDVETNSITYNNTVLLMTAKAGAPLKAVPPMGRCEEVWGPAWREALQLPRSRMGIVSHAVKMDGLPPFGIISHRDWSEELSVLVSTYGRPLCDFARMDMDAAVAVAAEDVQSAALAVRAALLDGDTTNAGLLAEAQAAVQNRYPFLLASFCRCNQVLPLRMSIFGSMGSSRKKGAAGVDYMRG